MSVIAWVALGSAAGLVAGRFTRGHGYGMAGNFVVGVLGAVLGGFLGSALLRLDIADLNGLSVLLAGLGAAALLALLQAVPESQPYE